MTKQILHLILDGVHLWPGHSSNALSYRLRTHTSDHEELDRHLPNKEEILFHNPQLLHRVLVSLSDSAMLKTGLLRVYIRLPLPPPVAAASASSSSPAFSMSSRASRKQNAPASEASPLPTIFEIPPRSLLNIQKRYADFEQTVASQLFSIWKMESIEQLVSSKPKKGATKPIYMLKPVGNEKDLESTLAMKYDENDEDYCFFAAEEMSQLCLSLAITYGADEDEDDEGEEIDIEIGNESDAFDTHRHGPTYLPLPQTLKDTMTHDTRLKAVVESPQFSSKRHFLFLLNLKENNKSPMRSDYVHWMTGAHWRSLRSFKLKSGSSSPESAALQIISAFDKWKDSNTASSLPPPPPSISSSHSSSSSSSSSSNVTELKACMLGSGGVGKSSLVIQFIQNIFLEEYDPTIEDSYRKQLNVDGQVFLYDILDSAGQEEYSALRDMYLRNSDAFIITYSITNRHSFEEARTFLESISRLKDTDVKHIPVVILGNKADLAQGGQRQVLTAEGSDLAKMNGCIFFESSAKTRVNVEEAFAALARQTMKLNSGNNGNKKKRDKRRIVDDSDDTEAVAQFSMDQHSGSIWTSIISHHGDVIVSQCRDSDIRMWDTKSGKCLKIFPGKNFAFALNQSGAVLFSSTEQNDIALWDTRSHSIICEPFAHMKGHTATILAMQCVRDVLYTGSRDGSVKAWNIHTLEEIQHFQSPVSEEIHSLLVLPSITPEIGSISSQNATISDPSQHSILCTRAAPSSLRLAVSAFSAFSKKKPSASATTFWCKTCNLTNRWDSLCANCADHCHKSRGHEVIPRQEENSVSSVAPPPALSKFQSIVKKQIHQTTGKSPSGSSSSCLPDLPCDCSVGGHGENCLLQSPITVDGANKLRFSKDVINSNNNNNQSFKEGRGEQQQEPKSRRFEDLIGSLFACDKHSVKQFDLKSGALVRVLSGHSGLVLSIKSDIDVNHKSPSLYSCSADGTIIKWCPRTGSILCHFRGHTDWINAMHLLDNGKLLMTGCKDQTCRLWNTSDGSCLKVLSGSHTDSIRCVTSSPLGDLLFSSGKDRSICVYDRVSGQLLDRIEGHSDWINTLQCIESKDSVLLLSGARDSTLRGWKVKSTPSSSSSSASSASSAPSKQVMSALVTVFGGSLARFQGLVQPRVQETLGFLKMAVDFVQLLAFPFSVGFGWDATHPLSNSLPFTQLNLSSILPANSEFGQWLTALIFAIVFLMSFMLAQPLHAWRGSAGSRLSHGIWTFVWMICWLASSVLFLPVARTLLSVLQCPSSLQSTTENNTCWNDTHSGLSALSLIILVPYTFLSLRLAVLDGDLSKSAFYFWFKSNHDRPELRYLHGFSKASTTADRPNFLVRLAMLIMSIFLAFRSDLNTTLASLLMIASIITWTSLLLFPAFHNWSLNCFSLALQSIIVEATICALAMTVSNKYDDNLQLWVMIPAFIGGALIMHGRLRYRTIIHRKMEAGRMTAM